MQIVGSLDGGIYCGDFESFIYFTSIIFGVVLILLKKTIVLFWIHILIKIIMVILFF